jgi:putative Ca2+/H+ antiporter (TMEM165/GDT1 family)
VLQSFTAALLLITVSELGDKTFFIAVILSMRYSRQLVFAGVAVALAIMTLISVIAGQAAALLPQAYIFYAEIALFIFFGVKLLYEASRMPPKANREATTAVVEVESKSTSKKTKLAICLEAFVLTFLAEWGDRTQIATLVLAASGNVYGVTAGAILGHATCTGIAVIGGRLLAGRISERLMTGLGGLLFLIFATVAWIKGP